VRDEADAGEPEKQHCLSLIKDRPRNAVATFTPACGASMLRFPMPGVGLSDYRIVADA
jgi:hypothetical protein